MDKRRPPEHFPNISRTFSEHFGRGKTATALKKKPTFFLAWFFFIAVAGLPRSGGPEMFGPVPEKLPVRWFPSVQR